jgi:CheY-like chemotaxis protein
MAENGATQCIPEAKLTGLRVVVVEDESLVAMLLEDTLVDMGCTVVAIASELGEAREVLSSADFDAAILDVNLNGSRTFEIAVSLAQRRIPFVFSTGYGANILPDHFRGVPVLTKPFRQEEFRQALLSALNAAERAVDSSP